MGGIAGAIGGSILGGVMGGGGDAPQQSSSSGGSNNSTTNGSFSTNNSSSSSSANDPWGPQQGHIKQLLQDAFHLYQTLPNRSAYFPGQTYANFAPETEQALNLTTQRALAGNTVSPLSEDQMNATLRGDYLYGGKGFDAAYQAAENKILPGIESRYAQGGRYGSGLSRQAEASGLADAFAGQYGQERQNQMGAMTFAPQLAQTKANLGYQDLAALAGVGQQREGLQQAGINESMDRWRFAQEEPWKNLARYASMIQGNYGGTTTGTASGTNTGTNTGTTSGTNTGNSTQTGFAGNAGSGILGGALGGMRLGSMIGNIPGLY